MTKRRNPPTNRNAPSRRGLAMTVTVCMTVLILINMIIIFQFSSADKTESGELSAGITQWLLERLYPEFSELTPTEQQTVLQSAHKFIRKAAHFSEFALLGFFTASLLLYISSHFKKLRVRLLIAAPILFTLLYAVSDEIHQMFTDRGPRVTDVLIDFSGAVCGILFIHGLAALFSRKRKGKKDTTKPKKHRRRKEPCETPDTN